MARASTIRGRYLVQKIYVIICEVCNEDITRTLSGEDVTTRAEADRAIAEHEKIWHAEEAPATS